VGFGSGKARGGEREAGAGAIITYLLGQLWLIDLSSMHYHLHKLVEPAYVAM
jgi:hypothetical protein